MIYKRILSIDSSYPVNNVTAPADVEYVISPMKMWGLQKSTFVCIGCRTERPVSQFPEVSGKELSFVENKKEKKRHSFYCQYCLNAYGEYFANMPGMDKRKALYRICGMIDVHYDDDLAQQVLNDTEKVHSDGLPVDSRLSFVDLYLRAAQAEPFFYQMGFYNSYNFGFQASVEKLFDPEVEEQRRIEEFRKEQKAKKVEEDRKKEIESGNVDAAIEEYNEKKKKKEASVELLSKVARDNRVLILQTFHQDPFADDSIEDRESMYADLVTMMDDAMNDDLVRQKSAIEIVRAFKRIDKLSMAIRKLQESPQAMIENSKELKNLIEQKSKETALVTSFSKDHGFAEKYAMSKSKGSGTLSAVVRDMKDYGYDNGTTNRYDIETSEAIKTVSDISAASIFKQLELQDSDYVDMVKEQAEEIKRLTDENRRLAEENRVCKEMKLKQKILGELEIKLRKKGIEDDDIESMLDKEIIKE